MSAGTCFFPRSFSFYAFFQESVSAIRLEIAHPRNETK